MKSRRIFRTALQVSCLVLLWHVHAPCLWSQEAQRTKSDSLQQQADAELRTSKDKVKIFLDKIEILGRIEKPQTVFILPGKDPSVDDIHIDRSFFKEIFRTIEKDDFNKRKKRSP
ncbi:MAG: hypothetical protein ACE5IR_11195 [bacterium]